MPDIPDIDIERLADWVNHLGSEYASAQAREASVEAARFLVSLADQGGELWICEVHQSTWNVVPGIEPDDELWAGCHFILWTFASGAGVDRKGNPTVERCRSSRVRVWPKD